MVPFMADLLMHLRSSYHFTRRVCAGIGSLRRSDLLFRPNMLYKTQVQPQEGSHQAQPSEEALLRLKQDASRWCPRCGVLLREQRCKLLCARCGYYMSCSDFY